MCKKEKLIKCVFYAKESTTFYDDTIFVPYTLTG